MNISSIATVDSKNCDMEPIHIPSSIQPHGLLLTLHPITLEILQMSENFAELLKLDQAKLCAKNLTDLLGSVGDNLIKLLKSHPLTESPSYLKTISFKEGVVVYYNVLAHIYDGVIFLEFEVTANAENITFQTLYPAIHSFTANLQTSISLEEVYQLTANEVQRITQYGRVLIYKFDKDWHGQVLAEARQDTGFPSMIGHHFPASDIPKQARELYRKNRLRIIPDAHYTPVKILPSINPITGNALDMSYSALRSVSPIHIEYMKNMETLASMSISIVIDGRLWGLISCHDRQPKQVSFEMRSACDFIGQFLSMQIAGKENMGEYERRIELKAIGAKLLKIMSYGDDFASALKHNQEILLSLAHAQGAAIIFNNKCTLLGKTPDENQVLELAEYLAQNVKEELIYSTNLSSIYAPAKEYIKIASGMIAIAISKIHCSYIIWFRPEVLQTVKWSGDPLKQTAIDNEPIHPRRSFATWYETVSNKSLPWLQSEIDAAMELRNSVMGIVLRKAEEMAQLTQELEESNHELEAFSHSVSHDLRAPFRHIVGYSEMIKELEFKNLSQRCQHYLNNVIEAGQYAGQLVDNLLHFSQIGRLPIDPVWIDINKLVAEVRKELDIEESGRKINWQIIDLPRIKGDLLLLRLVFRNLMANAVKYTAMRDVAKIEIGCTENEQEYIFNISDNGIGFEMQYVDKLFGIFQRLHKIEDFEGTGIGLANVKRIITRKGGRVWAEGEPDKGASFYFSLPKPEGE